MILVLQEIKLDCLGMSFLDADCKDCKYTELIEQLSADISENLRPNLSYREMTWPKD